MLPSVTQRGLLTAENEFRFDVHERRVQARSGLPSSFVQFSPNIDASWQSFSTENPTTPQLPPTSEFGPSSVFPLFLIHDVCQHGCCQRDQRLIFGYHSSQRHAPCISQCASMLTDMHWHSQSYCVHRRRLRRRPNLLHHRSQMPTHQGHHCRCEPSSDRPMELGRPAHL